MALGVTFLVSDTLCYESMRSACSLSAVLILLPEVRSLQQVAVALRRSTAVQIALFSRCGRRVEWRPRDVGLRANTAGLVDYVDDPRQRVMPLVDEVLGDVRIQKLAVWVAFISVMRLLKPFYSVLFMTFIFTYVGTSAVDAAQRLYGSWARAVVRGIEQFSQSQRRRVSSRDSAGMSWANQILKRQEVKSATRREVQLRKLMPPRKVFAALYIASVLLTAMTTTLRYGPIVARESQYVTTALTQEDPYLAAATAIRSGLGDKRAAQLEIVARSIVDQTDFFAALYSQQTSGRTVSTEKLSETLRRLATPHFVELGALCSSLLRPVPSLIYKVLTATLFSFLIVWDLPKFTASLAMLGQANQAWIRFAYRETGPTVRSFAKLLGTNFEIQGVIAIINTALTTAGLLLLDIPGARFLSLLVFVCSFVPVVGVFVSTIPACVLALAEHGGLRLAQVVIMVLVVHFIEAYLLYPQIYASKLKVHPLLVLVSSDSTASSSPHNNFLSHSAAGSTFSTTLSVGKVSSSPFPFPYSSSKLSSVPAKKAILTPTTARKSTSFLRQPRPRRLQRPSDRSKLFQIVLDPVSSRHPYPRYVVPCKGLGYSFQNAVAVRPLTQASQSFRKLGNPFFLMKCANLPSSGRSFRPVRTSSI